MWWSSGLIVIIVSNGAGPSKLACVTNFLSEEDQHGVTVYLGKEGDNGNVMEELVNTNGTTWTIIDQNTEPRAEYIGLPGNYIILSGDADSDSTVREAIHHFSSDVNKWNPSARVIVVLSDLKTSNTYSFVSSIITYLWNRMVYDTVIMTMSGADVQEIFSASPFDEGNKCGQKANTLRNLTCRCYTSHGPLWHHPNVYPNCTFKVSRRQTPPFSFNLTETHLVKMYTAGEWHGSDIQFIRLLRKKKKLNVMWLERPGPESGATEKEIHEYYRKLNRYGIDLAIGGNVLLSKYMNKVAYLRPHDQHRLLYYVVDADYMRGWPILHTMFTTCTWIVLGLAIFSAGLAYSLMTEGTLDVTRTRFLMIFSILVSQTILQPKRWGPRLFLVTLLLPLYHISSLHLTALQSFMLHTPLNKPLETENDLKAGNVTAYVSDANRFFILEKKNYVQFETLGDTLESRLLYLENYRNFTILTRSLEAKFWINIYQLKIHPLNEGITVLPVCMAMGRGNVYFDTVDNLVQQCLQVGLFAKWMRDLTLFRKRHATSVITSERPALDKSDLESAFFLLIAGYVAATSAFLGEHLFRMWQMKMPRRSKETTSRRRVLKKKFRYYVVQRQPLLLNRRRWY